MGWNERSDPDMRTANFCDVYREGVYSYQHIACYCGHKKLALLYLSHIYFNDFYFI